MRQRGAAGGRAYPRIYRQKSRPPPSGRWSLPTSGVLCGDTPHNNKRGFAACVGYSCPACSVCPAYLAHAAVGVFPDSTFQNLDHGLYWFGYGDAWQKAVARPDQRLLQRQQAHGDLRARLAERFKPGQEPRDLQPQGRRRPDLDLAYAWLAAGYNVGILYLKPVRR